MNLILNIFITLPVKLLLSFPITFFSIGCVLAGYGSTGDWIMNAFFDLRFK